MKINTNILSLSSQRSLERTTKALARSLERLASGKRINKAGDDPAGLAISEGLHSQIRAFSQTLRNLNDGKSLLRIADAGVASQIDNVQRMRELAIQSANGTLSADDRSYLGTEFNQLLEEYSRVANETQFNGVKLLDGSFGTISLQVGSSATDRISLDIEAVESTITIERSTTTSDGTFSLDQTIAGVGRVELVDLNSDGRLDIYRSGGGNIGMNESSYIQNEEGGFDLVMNANLHRADFGGFADVNEDGYVDMVTDQTSSSITELRIGNGDGTFGNSISILNGNYNTVNIGDVDRDGHLDLVVREHVADNSIGVLLGNGNGTFKAITTYGLPGGLLTIESSINIRKLVDIDNDDDLDFVTVSGNANMEIISFLNSGDGTFSTAVTSDIPDAPYENNLADFNGDGLLDFGYGEPGGDTLAFYYGSGDGSFSLDSNFDDGNYAGGPSAPHSTDLNADGIPDLMYNRPNPAVLYKLGNGDGTFGQSIALPTAGDLFKWGDLDGDGFQDLAVVNSTNSNLDIYLQDTTTTVTESVVSIATQEDAEDALEVLDTRLTALLSQRAQFGAYERRLDHAYGNNETVIENLAQARSQILDADYAEETAELTRNQILQQAGVSVLGQANVQAQAALALLSNIGGGR